MWLLSAAVVVVGALTVLNLILTLGVLKRLREQAEQQANTGSSEPTDPIMQPGETPDDFDVVSVDGEPVTRDGVSGLRLVAFVSPLCDMCEAQIPGLLDRAASMPGGRENVLVVVIGKGEGTAEYAEKFRDVAKVVVEPGNGQVNRAFRLGGVPAFGLLDEEARIVRSTIAIDRLDVPVAP
jgi:hypothetical protein